MTDPMTYRSSGVDIDAGAEAVRRIKEAVKATHGPAVLTGVGGFGSLFDLSGVLKDYKEPVLVQSVDGVGTKLMVAAMAGRYDTVGVDIVNHCLNDILCQGARGLTFLDYIAVETLRPEMAQGLVEGMAMACAEAGVALVGGETAELPGIYVKGEYDLAGVITGVVEKSRMITGRDIAPGDVIVGLPSSGLHTNGYTLARKVIFGKLKMTMDTIPRELGRPVGEELLEPHRDYSKALWPLLQKFDVKGLAHVTGGGLIDNIPRILPSGVDAEIKLSAWETPAIFRLIQEGGGVPGDDMYRTFNMGIGMVAVTGPDEAEGLMDGLRGAGRGPVVIGEMVEGSGVVRLLE